MLLVNVPRAYEHAPSLSKSTERAILQAQNISPTELPAVVPLTFRTAQP